MEILDWIVLVGTLAFIVVYGSWKSRGSKDIKGYLLGGKEAGWLTVALSIMATQASAITFLSAPGQAYSDGMRFVQFYFGLPIAMVVLSMTVVPFYHRLNVYTAYEFLEKRFDVWTRTLTAFLFLMQRGLAAGFTIFAPSLILSSLLGWDINLTNALIGIMVIVYTFTGGTKAVNQTQKYQMVVILFGMFIAGVLVVEMLPDEVSFGSAMKIAGKMGKLNAVDFDFDLSSRYNIWTGVIGGFFLALSYFGTDQSQVQRYLSGSSVKQSRLGLLFNGMAKIPMQFLILFIGAMVYVFYIFHQPPVVFNKVLLENTQETAMHDELLAAESAYIDAYEEKKKSAFSYVDALEEGDDAKTEEAITHLRASDEEMKKAREEAKTIIETADPSADTNDINYIFLTFVIDYLPTGIVGLLIAVILSASMSSTSGELNALASTTLVDIYKRLGKKEASDAHYLKVSKWITVFWGGYAILFAMYANRLGSLIEAVNILGSLVYGTILGIFLTAFYVKRAGSRATFIAAVLSEAIILFCYFHPAINIPYLWYNVIGSISVMIFALIIQMMRGGSGHEAV
ncbi:sodium:solute symporter [Flammeovirgaceae bacterium SG7u.111]|nr:sodium:solute symporter [Flammeovirgaceae bacterium SG7u.132]WPO34128.1 sodium:solute symporter [Flammeovirgaceae bacterium SG7u.111]